jgi:hypothetical protein
MILDCHHGFDVAGGTPGVGSGMLIYFSFHNPARTAGLRPFSCA